MIAPTRLDLAAIKTVANELIDIEVLKSISANAKFICSNTIWSVKIAGVVDEKWKSNVKILNLPRSLQSDVLLFGFSIIAQRIVSQLSTRPKLHLQLAATAAIAKILRTGVPVTNLTL